MPVKLIDTNRAHLRAAEREGLAVHSGDGLDDTAMESAGVEETLMLIAATPNAEVNVLTAHLAADYGVPEISVMLRDSDTRTFGNRLTDVEAAVMPAPEDIADWEHAISTGEAVTDTIEVGENSGSKWTDDGSETFPLVVIRSGERFPYTSEVSLSEGDQVVYLKRKGAPTPVLDPDEPAVSAEG